MKQSSLTRKQRNLYALLFVATVLSTTSVQAQSFDSLSPVETLVHEVADGTAQIVQFEDLQAFAIEQQLKSDITDLANNDTTDAYFDQTFNIDGAFGEQKDGLIVEGWDTVAKAMGISAAIAAGAYSLWYRRRRDYLSRLRNGDVSLIEDLFENSEENLESFDTADWEIWAIEKGVPGTATLIASLFAVWNRRQLSPANSTPTARDLFMQSIWKDSNKSWSHRYTKQGFSDLHRVRLATTIAKEKERLMEGYVAPIKDDFYNLDIDLEPYRVAANDLTLPASERLEAKKELLYQAQRKYKFWTTKGYQYRRHYYAFYSEAQQIAAQVYPNKYQRRNELLNLDRLINQEITSANVAYSNQVGIYTAKSREVNQLVNEKYADYGYHDASQYYHRFRQAADDDLLWDKSIDEFADVSEQRQSELRALDKKEFDASLIGLLSQFDNEDLNDLLNNGTETEDDFDVSVSIVEKASQLEGDLENLRTKYQIDPKIYFDWEAGVWKRTIYSSTYGSTYSQETGLGSLTSANRLENYELAAQKLRNEFKDYKNAYEKAQTLKFFNANSNDSKDENFLTHRSKIAPIVQTLQLFKKYQNHELVASVLGDLNLLRELMVEKTTLEKSIFNIKTAWSVRQHQQEKLAMLEQQEKSLLEKVAHLRDILFSDSGNTNLINNSMAQFQLADTQQLLEKNEVHQWVELQTANREFAEKYGIYDRENYLKTKIDPLEKQIDYYTNLNRSRANYQYLSTVEMKRELADLKANKISDVNDVQLTALNFWLAQQGINASARATNAYQNKLAERDARVAELAKTRGDYWQSQQTETLESKFTAEEIAAYELLKEESNLAAQASVVITDKIDNAEVQYKVAIANQNQQYAESTAVPTGPFIPFDIEELQTVSLTVEEPVSVPDFLSDVYFESYRRFQTDKAAFADEVERLALQSKALARLDQIDKRNIPNPPVQTKEVRDYMDDPQRTVDDVDREIAEVRAGIEILKAEQLDSNTSVARKNYLTTALAQADLKIKALERYKALGPTATEAYKTAVKNYEATHALTLQEVDRHLDEKYANATQYVDGYWGIASDLLEQKQAENDYVPTDPSLVELVDPAPTEAEIQVNLDAGWAGLVSKLTTFNPALLNAKTALNNAANTETWDSVTNARIKQLNPAIAANATAFINQVEKELGVRLRISDGLRSFDRQAELYSQGRTTDGNIVTNAGAGLSYHNYGQAIDVVEIKDGAANYDLDWDAIGAIGKKLGFEWGGDWTSFADRPHFQMTLGKTPQQLLTLKNLGQLVDDKYFDETAVARAEKEAAIEAQILANIEEDRSLTASNNLLGPRLDLLKQEFVDNNIEKVETIITAHIDDGMPRYESEAWLELMISAIRTGERDFISFTGSEKAELEALIVAAKESKGWVTFGAEEKRLREFIGAAENITEYQARKQKTNDLLTALNLATTVGGIALNFNIRNLIFDAIRDNDSFLSIKNILEAFLQAQNDIASNNVSNPQVFAASFQADVQSFIDTFQPPIREYTYEQTKWHFEDRAALNSSLPTHEEIIADNLLQESLGKDVEWLKFPSAQNKAHDNNFGEPEIKFVHRDGREAIFDGDNFSLVTDTDLMGTYNYINAMPLNTVTASNLHEFITSGIGHLIVDYLPYKTLGGNVR